MDTIRSRAGLTVSISALKALDLTWAGWHRRSAAWVQIISIPCRVNLPKPGDDAIHFIWITPILQPHLKDSVWPCGAVPDLNALSQQDRNLVTGEERSLYGNGVCYGRILRARILDHLPCSWEVRCSWGVSKRLVWAMSTLPPTSRLPPFRQKFPFFDLLRDDMIHSC